MKKMYFLLSILFLTSSLVNAQLKVANTGNVGVSISDDIEPLSKLSIGWAGQTNSRLSINDTVGTVTSNQYGISSLLNMSLHDVTMCSIEGKSTGVSSTLIGVRGEAQASSGVVMFDHMATHTSSYGVYGIAGGSMRNNYGVFGTLQYNGGDGAGIFGTISGIEYNIGGRYAGYFRGQTKVNGDFYAVTLNTYTPYPSVVRNAFEGEETNRLLSLQVIQYQLHDSTRNETTKHYGIEPKEMQKLFPDLVQEDKDGNFNINYVELIPLLLMKVQELSAEVEELKASPKAKTLSSMKNTSDEETLEAILYQNNPNPFTEVTKVEYQLPQTTQSATLYIYNMNGLQVAEYPILTFGNGYVSVSAGALDAGMYLYSLVADGQVIDTKRMILTK